MAYIVDVLHSFALTDKDTLLLLLAAWFCLLFLVLRLEPKRFYIIRHGRTLLNEARIKQGLEGALSAAGIAQAERVGRYVAPLKIEAIYTSPYERAIQTAEVIQRIAHGRIRKTPLLAERRNPSEVIGKPVEDPEVLAIVNRMEKGFHEDGYRYSDEENFEDLKRRAKRCLAYLERRGEHRMVLVTHHAFLQVFLSYMLYRDRLKAADYVKLAFFNPAENGGMTICEYHPWKRFGKTRGWEVLAYNEPL